MQEKLRILIIEDSEKDAFLILRELERGGFTIESERVATEAGMTSALRTKHWDLVISDYSMPQFNGHHALAVYQQSGVDAPFFLVSGQVGEHIAVDMLKAGAHYYVKKEQLARLVPAVRKELAAATERRIHQQSEEAARYLASLVAWCDDAIVGLTLQGKIVSWNLGAERLYGHYASEMINCPISCILPQYRPHDILEMLNRIKSDARGEDFETVHIRKGGVPVEVLVKLSPVKNSGGRVIGASAIVKDITQRKVEDAERLALIQDLSAALAKVNSLNSIV